MISATCPRRFLPRAQYVSLDSSVMIFTVVSRIHQRAVVGWPLRNRHGARRAFGIAKGRRPNRKRRARGASQIARGGRSDARVCACWQARDYWSAVFRAFRRLIPACKQPGVSDLTVNIPSKRYAAPQQQLEFYKDVQQRVAALPGVDSVMYTSLQPASGDDEDVRR